LGGGGGGAGAPSVPGNSTGGIGGIGVVVIRYPGTVAVATGGTITYTGGVYVRHTFTTSGSLVMN
jgi:hypothetical protein